MRYYNLHRNNKGNLVIQWLGKTTIEYGDIGKYKEINEKKNYIYIKILINNNSIKHSGLKESC